MNFVLSMVSFALAPLAVEVLPQTAQRSERPVLNLIVSILLYIAAPLCAGLWMARRVPRSAVQLVPPLEILASGVFIFLMRETKHGHEPPLMQGPNQATGCRLFFGPIRSQ